jgi:hypothetical protein
VVGQTWGERMAAREHTHGRRAGACLLAISLLAAGPGAGCGAGDGAAKTNAVSVKGADYAFLMPDRINGGVVTMKVSNVGRELHEYALGRLKQGTTLADLKKQLERSEEPSGVEELAGVPGLSPRTEIAITRKLREGNYVFVCFVPSPKGVPHYKLGMIKAFEVVGTSGAKLSNPDATVTARDKAMEVPNLQAGQQTLELKNGASRPREFELLSLKPGKTTEDVQAFMEQGRPDLNAAPATFLGAIQTIAPGESVLLEVSLKSGRRYVFQDADNGIVKEFSVS